MKKAQIALTDLIFSLFIFLAIVIITSLAWSNTLIKMDEIEGYSEIQKKTYLVSYQLIESSGYPLGWNVSTYTLIGLVDSRNVLSMRKWDEFLKLDNETLKENLGVPEYGLHVELRRLDNTIINATGETPSDYSISSSMISYVLYNNSVSKLYVTLWE